MRLLLRFTLLLVLLLIPTWSLAEKMTEPLKDEAGKLLALSVPPTKPRFAIAPPDWPRAAGEASVCLWADDKIAAISLTIDDNEAQDVPFWLDLAEKNGVTLTWFLVTGGIDVPGKTGLSGTWDLWKSVKAAGHSIQSHTVTHLGGMRKPDWKGIDWEYAESKRVLDEQLPGQRTLALAYPGTGDERQKANSAVAAAQHYVAARSTVGMLNAANKIEYMGVNSPFSINLGTNPKAPWSNIKTLLDTDPATPHQKAYYRGWCVLGFHHIDKKPDTKSTHTPERVTALMDWIGENRESLWAGAFVDVAMYAQERDTAELKTISCDDRKIVLSLESQMSAKLFTYPLTIKVRLPDAWQSAAATQAGNPLGAKTVVHESAVFALVKAVPGSGEITITPEK